MRKNEKVKKGAYAKANIRGDRETETEREESLTEMIGRQNIKH